MKKIFITGGAGFLGSNVVKKLVSDGHDVTVYDSFVIYTKPDPDSTQLNYNLRLQSVFDDINVIRGDTLNKDYLRRNLNAIKPDIIIHMAAMPLAALALEHTEEAYNSILTSTQNILEVMRDFDHNCRLVFISSSMVYGDFLTNPVNELHEKNPKDIYGAFKLAGEYIVNGYAKNYSLGTVIVRPSAVYGPLDANSRVARKFIINALNGEPLSIDGDGSLKMDFSYVEDTADGICLSSTREGIEGNTYNITRGEARTLKELAETIKKHIPSVEINYRPIPAHIPSRGTLDIAKAKQDLDYEPTVDLDEGISRYIEHLKENPF
jgi:nucleoside-diphosphate-sugar epimerase